MNGIGFSDFHKLQSIPTERQQTLLLYYSRKKYKLVFRKLMTKVILTAQFGSSATNVGDKPRYKPLTPSVRIMFCKLVIITPPDSHKQKTRHN